MTYMYCRNRVADYQRWKAVFDTHLEAHHEAGLRLIHLGRELEDPQNVFFVFEVLDLEKAKAFVSDPAAAEAGEASGVIDGEIHLVESAPA